MDNMIFSIDYNGLIKDPMFWIIIFSIVLILVFDFYKNLKRIKLFKRNLKTLATQLNGVYFEEKSAVKNLKEKIQSSKSLTDRFDKLVDLLFDYNFLPSSTALVNISGNSFVIDSHLMRFREVSKIYTRARTRLLLPVGLDLELSTANFYEKIKQKIIKDIEIGDKKFDDNFIIFSNNKDLISYIFSDDTIKNLMYSFDKIYLRFKDNILSFYVSDLVFNLEQMLQFVILVSMITIKVREFYSKEGVKNGV